MQEKLRGRKRKWEDEEDDAPEPVSVSSSSDDSSQGEDRDNKEADLSIIPAKRRKGQGIITDDGGGCSKLSGLAPEQSAENSEHTEKQKKLTSISTQLGKLIPHYFIAQGYPMKANFNWKKESLEVDILSNGVVTPPELKWPIYRSFRIELQNCKEQSWEIEGACEKGGKCGSLEIPTTDIEGYADKDKQLHFDIYSIE